MPARDPALPQGLPHLSSSHASSVLPSYMKQGSDGGAPSSGGSSNPLSSSMGMGMGGQLGGIGRRGSMPSQYPSEDHHKHGSMSKSVGKRRMGAWTSLSESGRKRHASDDAVVVGDATRRDRSRDSEESAHGDHEADNSSYSHHKTTSAAIRDDTARLALASMSYSSSIPNASETHNGPFSSSSKGHLDIPPPSPSSSTAAPVELVKSDGSPRKRTAGYKTPSSVAADLPGSLQEESTSLSNVIRGPSGLSVMLERNSRPSSTSNSQNASPETEAKIGPSQTSLVPPPQQASAIGLSPLLGAPKATVSSRRSSGNSDNVKVGEVGATGGDDGSESEDDEDTPRPLHQSLLTTSLRAQEKQATASSNPPTPAYSDDPSPSEAQITTERTPLLDYPKAPSYRPHSPARSLPHPDEQTFLQRSRDGVQEAIRAVKKTTWYDVFDMGVKQPVANIPAVILGLLLNVLDGVSYGMILFPASAVFTDFGSIGVSMFFMSCIISQLTYSLGGSIFKGGNGSMMIEAVPFFHILVNIISDEVGDNPAAIISTTMFSFAFSSVLTGLVFMALGSFRLGTLIGYFPRHILVGCIGGVGVFLIETGLEVSRGLKEEGFVYNFATLKFFFESGHAIALWMIPLALAILLRLITHKFTHQLIFPTYFFIIPVLFYIIIAIGGWKIPYLRDSGWVFDVGQASQPWYKFYTLFDIRQFSWPAFWACIPTQMALVFFGILHVPLNVPALGVSLSEDNVKLDRELVAHGISNMASGFLGSVPNYLCYVNTVLFYRVGGGSRLSGVMLAAGTAVIMFIGPNVIGYLPVTVVGALIFVLGIDLTKEAVWDTRHRVNRMEYITIWAITIGMTIFDFVIGLLLGIILASVFFVVQNSRRKAIRAVFTGSTAKSTVRRPHSQRAFIQDVGKQTVVMKLQGFLFFGTITKVEDEIRQLIDLAAWEKNPIRFLIVDFALVTGLDFSSAEAFVRIQRLLALKDVLLILSGANPHGNVGTALRAVDLWADQEGTRIEVFDTMNDALEWTENAYLTAFYAASHSAKGGPQKVGMDFPEVDKPPFALSESFENSPRRSHLAQAGDFALPRHPRQSFSSESSPQTPSRPSFVQPLPIMLQTFSSYTSESHDFFFQLVRYFEPMDAKTGDIIWRQNEDADGLFLIESGCLRATYEYEDHSELLQETMVAGTVAGELSFLSGSKRNATVVAERDCKLWKLNNEKLKLLEKEKPEIARQFVKIVLKVAAEEADVLSSYMIAVLS